MGGEVSQARAEGQAGAGGAEARPTAAAARTVRVAICRAILQRFDALLPAGVADVVVGAGGGQEGRQEGGKEEAHGAGQRRREREGEQKGERLGAGWCAGCELMVRLACSAPYEDCRATRFGSPAGGAHAAPAPRSWRPNRVASIIWRAACRMARGAPLPTALEGCRAGRQHRRCACGTEGASTPCFDVCSSPVALPTALSKAGRGYR